MTKYDKKRGIERITFEAPIDLMKIVRARADRDGISMADVIRMMIRKGLVDV